tara:strand:+ start:1526 stop:1732 length:207 start_codon:yes stop_codon:yes gene_type:complete
MKEKLELQGFTEEYNAYVEQLHNNISTLKLQLGEATSTIKQLRKELSIAKQKKGIGNAWAELDDGRSS